MPSAVFVIVILILGSIFADQALIFFNSLQDFVSNNFGWFYLLSVAGFLFFIVWLMCSHYGRIRLGPDDEEPEYGLLTWFAMLFSAGMGIGLLFYSVAEPIKLFSNPPGHLVPENSATAALDAMRYTFFHWGFHAWGIYIIIGLSLAYFSYRHKLPLTIRSVLYPILGEKIYGFWGNLVEIMAVLGTLFGVATSLGLGAMQVNSGLNHLNFFTNTTGHQIVLILIITSIATLSAVSGVDKGIRRLSELNLFLGILLLIFVFIAGGPSFLLMAFVQNIGNYLQTFIKTTFDTGLFRNTSFQKEWTLFYWGWWIASSPFVGMFIARISKGRTIREFIAGVLIVPSLLSFFWLTVFGNTALSIQIFGNGGMVEAVDSNIATSLFVLLEKLPLQTISSTLAIFVIVFFFVTSADSASLVVDLITAGGQKKTPLWQKVFWAFSIGLIAIVLLLSGGLVALQTAVITMALPFAVIMLFICFSLWKGLKTEVEIKKAKSNISAHGVLLSKESISVPGISPVDTPISKTFDIESQDILSNIPAKEEIIENCSSELYEENWKKRLERLKKRSFHKFFAYHYDNLPEEGLQKMNHKLEDFIQNIVKPAFEEIESEILKYDRSVKLSISTHQASIIVLKDDIEELYYGIRGKIYHKYGYTFPAFNPTDVKMECFAQVILRSGPKKVHELKRFTPEHIIHDFLNEYEKWAILN
ncbi:BCCT family transporter [Lentisphaerota bacterium ZTH]|nr:BCCT family transporter [Lentisphaerota bacterium ZTH]